MTIERIDKGGEIRVRRNPDFKSPSKNVTTGAYILGDIKDFVYECELAGAMDNTIVVAGIEPDPETGTQHCSSLYVTTEMGLPAVAQPSPPPVPWQQNPFRVGALVSIVWLFLFLGLVFVL